MSVGNGKRICSPASKFDQILDVKVYKGTQRSFLEAPEAVVAIRAMTRDQLHLGIVFRCEQTGGKSTMIHLAWYRRLLSQEADPEYTWVQPAFNVRRARQVAVYCSEVVLNNPMGIPYAFSNPDGALDERGTFGADRDHLGLTCASFVLAVFSAIGLPLVIVNSWPKGRDGDAEWQESMVKKLEASRIPAAEIERIRQEIGNERFRPEEVAAASGVSPHPAHFDAVAPYVEELRNLLRDPERA